MKIAGKKGKEEAISIILKALGAEEAFDAIMKREDLSSTLVTPLIAIPHARSEAVKSLTWAVALFDDGVSWNGGVAKIVVLTLSPKDATGEHVIFLSHVAKILEDKEKLERLINAKSTEEMEEAFVL